MFKLLLLIIVIICNLHLALVEDATPQKRYRFLATSQDHFDSNINSEYLTRSGQDECMLEALEVEASGSSSSFLPLIINNRNLPKDIRSFFMPNSMAEVIFPLKSRITFSCPGSQFVNIVDKTVNTLVTECVDGMIFKNFRCTKYPQSTVIRSEESCGINRDSSIFKIGYVVSEIFYELYSVCYNINKLHPEYSVYMWTQTMGWAKTYRERESFKFYVPNILINNTPYFKAAWIKKKSQLELLRKMTRTNDVILTMMQTNINKYYFAKGHLTPNADFVYSAHRLSTFYYINTAPQWQPFNNGNWKSLEDKIRHYLTCYTGLIRRDIRVYTGTHDILHGKNNEDLCLNRTQSGCKIIIPKYFWKVLYDPIDNLGVAFVIHNDPNVNNPEPVCADFCDRLNWLGDWSSDRQIQKKGYAYCCKVSELNFPSIPGNIRTEQLLLTR